MAADLQTEEKSRSIPMKEQMHILFRIIKFTRPYIKQFAVAILLVIALAVLSAIQPRVIQIFIDEHLALGTATRQTAVIFGAIYFGVSLLRAVTTFFELYLFNMASEKTVLNVRNLLFEKVHSLGMKFFDNTSTGWVVTRVTNDTEALKDFWNVLLNIIQSTLSVITTFVAMLILDWQISLWILIFVPLLLGVTRFYQVYSSRTYSEMKSKNSMLNTQLAESINGMSIIQQFRQEQRMVNEFEETNDSYFQSRFSMTKLNAKIG